MPFKSYDLVTVVSLPECDTSLWRDFVQVNKST